MLSLYPAIEPFRQYHLAVSNAAPTDVQTDALTETLIDGLANKNSVAEHHLYIEQCGNPSGIPVIFLHGGPGSGFRPAHRCYFDPQRYHIILFDQRGCGRSRPYGSLKQNTTANLVQDMEVIRQHIGIDKWLVFGGSWGATLALYYAKHFPKQVSALILRGLFLGRQQDIDWVYSENGAANIYPEAWSNLVKHLPLSQQAQPLSAIYQQLTDDNSEVSNNIFTKIQHWEASLIYWQQSLSLADSSKEKNSTAEADKSPAIIQLYYSLNQCFIAKEPLLNNIESIRHIPTKIIHGRHDMVCPVAQAWQLKKLWPEAELSIIEMAGHLANEAKIIDALVKATNDFAKCK